METEFPVIAKIARSVIGIPSTSCASERALSKAGNILNNKRCSLNADSVKMAVMCYENRNLIPEYKSDTYKTKRDRPETETTQKPTQKTQSDESEDSDYEFDESSDPASEDEEWIKVFSNQIFRI